MLKHLRNALVGLVALVTFAAPALAATGIPPLANGAEALINQAWLYGLSGGTNQLYLANLTATGTNQATALQLPGGIYLYEVDTVASSTGVALPPAIAGTEVYIYNNGAQTLAVYPSIANNGATGAQDTINKGTSLSGGIAAGAAAIFFCAKNGVWAAR